MISVSEFRGMSGGLNGTIVSRSPERWARFHHQVASEAKAEAAMLTDEGFGDGLTQAFGNAHGQGVYEALVFGSPKGAAQRLKASMSEADTTLGQKVRVVRFPVAGIPGSIVYSEFDASEHSGASNVLFASGRCTFVVSDFLSDIATRAQGAKASISVANRVYRRVKRICA